MNENFRPRLMLMASMAIFGTLAPFVRNIGAASGELALYRAVMAAVLVGAFLLLKGEAIPLRAGRELWLLLLSGAAMGFNWILLFEAYKYTTVSVATLSYYFAPVMVTILCPVLFREKLTKKQILCFGMSTLGLVLVINVGGLAGGGRDYIGVLFGLGAACLYASVILLNKFIQTVAGLPRTFLQFIAAILVLTPYVLSTGGVTLGGLNATGWVCLLVVGLVHTGLAYCLYFSSLKELPGQTAAILSYVDPLVAVLISVLVLGEGITAIQLLGGGLILGFTLWNELGSAKS